MADEEGGSATEKMQEVLNNRIAEYEEKALNDNISPNEVVEYVTLKKTLEELG